MRIYKIKPLNTGYTLDGISIDGREFLAIKILDSYIIWSNSAYYYLANYQVSLIDEIEFEKKENSITKNSSLLSAIGVKPSEILIKF